MEFVGSGAATQLQLTSSGGLQTNLVQSLDGSQTMQAPEGGHVRKRATRHLGRQAAAHAGVGADAVYGEKVCVGPLSVNGKLPGLSSAGGSRDHSWRKFQKRLDAT